MKRIMVLNGSSRPNAFTDALIAPLKQVPNHRAMKLM